MNSILDILLRGMDMIWNPAGIWCDKLYFGVQASPFLDDAFCFCYRSGTWIWSLVFYGGQ